MNGCGNMYSYAYLHKIIISFIFLIWLFFSFRHKDDFRKKFAIVILGAYTVIAVGIFFFPIYIPNSQFVPDGNYLLLNLIPFKSIMETVQQMLHPSISVSVGDCLKILFGNILIFTPLGLLIPVIFQKFRSKWKILIFLTVTSCSIELIQALIDIITQLPNRTADIDDVILNVCGGMLGYLCFRLFNKIFKEPQSRQNLSSD